VYVSLRLPRSVAERLAMVARHYSVGFTPLLTAILCEWVNEHAPYRAARASSSAWWDRRMREP
jgi:hypothetical protein